MVVTASTCTILHSSTTKTQTLNYQRPLPSLWWLAIQLTSPLVLPASGSGSTHMCTSHSTCLYNRFFCLLRLQQLLSWLAVFNAVIVRNGASLNTKTGHMYITCMMWYFPSQVNTVHPCTKLIIIVHWWTACKSLLVWSFLHGFSKWFFSLIQYFSLTWFR